MNLNLRKSTKLDELSKKKVTMFYLNNSHLYFPWETGPRKAGFY